MLTVANLALSETRVGNRFRFSYEDENGPTAEGLVDIIWDQKSEGDGYNDPIYVTSTFDIRIEKIKVWDSEGFSEITYTELGERFTEELEYLIREIKEL